ILSGGLHNIDDADCHRYDPDIFNLGLPVLGIGYGMQLIAQQYGGYVEKAADRKYEKSRLTVNNDARLFKNTPAEQTVWIGHRGPGIAAPATPQVARPRASVPLAAIRRPDTAL